jgi:hypothetical protein
VQILQLTLVVLTGLALPAIICRSDAVSQKLNFKEPKPKKLERVMPAAGTVQDAASGQALLQAQRPDWILIGNSMLNCRVKQDYLREISGQRVTELSISATKSAMWFLMFKRMVLESGVKPRCVTFFFKDRDLTWPERRVHSNEEMIARLDGRLQPEWQQVLGDYDEALRQPFIDLSRQIGSTLNQLLPAEPLREWARAKLQKTSFNATQFGATHDYAARRSELNKVLSAENQRTDVKRAVQEDPAVLARKERQRRIEDIEPLEFNPAASASFLPHLIALAKEQGIKLHFHRIKVNPSLERTDSIPERTMPKYLADLSAYLQREGCLFTDESDEPSLTQEMYVDDVHLMEITEIQNRYMTTFWQRTKGTVSAVLPAPAR